MERMRDGVRLGCLGFWLDCCLLASCLGLWLNCCLLTGCLGLWLDCCRLVGCLGLWLACGYLDGAWGSGSVYLEKVPAFFDFAGTFFDAKPIETH